MTIPAARALILTAGRGIRLRPLTHDRAKAAIPLTGVPLIHRILRWASRQVLSDVVLNLHHCPETITALLGEGAEFGLRLRYSFEPTLLGSAGGPRHALSLLDRKRFFLINGDTLTDLALADLERAHETSGAAVTLAVTPHPAPKKYGGLVADANGRVCGFTRAGDRQSAWHFVGVQLAEAHVFAALGDGIPAATIPDLYATLIARDPSAVRIWPVNAAFDEVGTPADYLRTALAYAACEGEERALIGHGCRISPAATVVRSVLWDDVRVEPGATLIECVVGDHVTVTPGLRFERRAIVRAGTRRPGPGEELVGDLLVAPLEPLDQRTAESDHERVSAQGPRDQD